MFASRPQRVLFELLAAASAVFVVIHSHLVPALLGGLVAYIISCDVQSYAQRRQHHWPQWVTYSLAAVAALASIVALIGGVFAAFRSVDIAGLSASVIKGLEALHLMLPPALENYLPAGSGSVQEALAGFVSSKSEIIRGAGLGILHGTVHTIIGAVVGLMLSFEKFCPAHPAASRIAEMASGLVLAFRGVMVAQAKISAINATLTGIFLLGVMPVLGFQLPLAKSLVLLTFVVGLLPVLGNLISNSAITLVALLVSPVAAAIALVFLVVVHKLEYFLNAKIVGGEIGAKAWELLLAMLLAEASFGVPGLVVAPVTYVWLRDMVVADDATDANGTV